MLKIRLKRVGKKKQAYYRVVLGEHTQKPNGKYLELLGFWDPHKNEAKFENERINYWLSHGAQATDTVHNLLVAHSVIPGDKRTVWKPKKKQGEAEQSAAPAAVAPAEAKPVEDAKAEPETEKQEQSKEKAQSDKKSEQPKEEEKKVEQTEDADVEKTKEE